LGNASTATELVRDGKIAERLQRALDRFEAGVLALALDFAAKVGS
jgi:hypothetical protein